MTCAGFRTLPILLLLFGWGSGVVSATVLSEDVPLVGGTKAFAQALGISPSPDAPRFLAELTRLVYNIPEKKSPEVELKIQRLVEYLEVVRKFQISLAAVQPSGDGIALSKATQRTQRDQLKDFLDLIGLRLRERRHVFSVERTGNKQGADRLRILGTLGIDLSSVQSRLNAGETVSISVPTELVPVPLAAKAWSDIVFERQVAPRDLVAAILSDRDAALLCRGLAGLDDPTLDFLQAHPPILRRLYEHDAVVFSAFGDSLRIRNGVVIPPGGEKATALWEAVLGEKADRPDRFVRELFSKAQGREAYLYSTIDHLDQAQRNFALGVWIKEAGIRLDRFKALSDLADSAFSEWQPRIVPFGRAPYDLAMLLAEVRVTDDGTPGGPRARRFWSRAFDGADLRGDSANQLRNVHQDGDIDAAWLGDRIVAREVHERQHRFDQFTFGQRVFAAADERQLPNALVGVRAFASFPMLMLALERAGVRDPAVFASAARHAERLDQLDSNHAFVALSQFQGSLAILVRLARVRVLKPEQGEALVAALAATSVNSDGWYQGAIARWIRGPLAQVLGLRKDAVDEGLETALAGPQPVGATQATVNWESHRYRVDLVAPEHRRLERMRERTRRAPIDIALALGSIAETLARSTATMADVESTIARLKTLPIPATKQERLPGLDAPRPARDIIGRMIQDLSRIKKPKDVRRSASVSEALGRIVDTWLADSLRSLVYALDLGDPEGTVLTGLDVSGRHDFGFALPERDAQDRGRWAEPRQQTAVGVPWHVQGSLLNLDLALAPLALRRVSDRTAGRPPVLNDNERDTITATATLLNPFTLHDADREAIVAAIGRGRDRVRGLRGTSLTEALDRFREDISMDGWRRRAIQWSVEHGRDPASLFSLVDLLYLGHPPDQRVLDHWGTASRPGDSCVCSHLSPPGGWVIAAGRPQLGLLATQMADLNLRVAEVLHELRLPAALTPGVLLAATQDFIDEVDPTDASDWLTLVRAAQDLKREHIEDYVSALAAGGALLPDDVATGAAR